MKKKTIILVALIVLILSFLAYKIIMLNKYKAEIIEIDTNLIFKETLTIKQEGEISENRIYIDNMSFENYFSDYVDAKEGIKLKEKYDENNEVISFYSTSLMTQYINLLNPKSFEIGLNNSADKDTKTSEDTRKYLDKHNIKNDADLLKYIKDNYYLKNNIFMCTSTMKNNYLINSFVSDTLVQYKEIILIDGDIEGYIIDAMNAYDKGVKAIFILKDGKQYVITLGGSELTNNEFITKLLSSIKFD